MTDQIEQYREQYEEIMTLYDCADELAATIESEFVDNAANQLGLVEPLIVQLEESADVLTEEFIQLADGQEPIQSRGKVEKALRKVYTAIDDYTMRLHGSLKRKKRGIKNIADAIILKIKEKMEEVVVAFLNFMQLSLDRVMQKSELDEIKRNQDHVFFQLHNMSQQH
jgi:hypothetical protein